MVIGGNSCLQSYYPQRFRMSYTGHIAQDDFCFTPVNKDDVTYESDDVKYGDDVYGVVTKLCEENSLDQKWERVRPDWQVSKKLGLKGILIRSKADKSLCLDVSEVHTKGTPLRI